MMASATRPSRSRRTASRASCSGEAGSLMPKSAKVMQRRNNPAAARVLLREQQCRCEFITKEGLKHANEQGVECGVGGCGRDVVYVGAGWRIRCRGYRDRQMHGREFLQGHFRLQVREKQL